MNLLNTAITMSSREIAEAGVISQPQIEDGIKAANSVLTEIDFN